MPPVRPVGLLCPACSIHPLPLAFSCLACRFLLPSLPVVLCGRRGVDMVGGRGGVDSGRDATCG